MCIANTHALTPGNKYAVGYDWSVGRVWRGKYDGFGRLEWDKYMSGWGKYGMWVGWVG